MNYMKINQVITPSLMLQIIKKIISKMYQFKFKIN